MAPRVSRWERQDGAVVSVAFSRGLMAQQQQNGSSPSNSSGGGVDVVDDDGGQSGSNSSSTSSPSTAMMKSVPVPPPPGLGATERELEYFLRDALSSCILLERYPRCVIQVVLQIVQADGSVLGTAVNCAILALMDAGVAMGGLPVASTCVVLPEYSFSVGDKSDGSGKGGKKDNTNNNAITTIWLDPTADEESGEGHAIVVHVTDMASSSTSAATKSREKKEGSSDHSGGIITSFTFGAPLSLKGLLLSVESTSRSGAAMVAFMRLAIEQKVQKEVQTLWA